MSSVLNNSWRITATGDPHECNRLLRFSGFVPNRPFAWHVSRFWKYTRRIQNQMDTWYPCSDYIWAPNNWLVITLHSCVECNLYLIRCNEAREAYLSTLSNPQAKISAYTGPIDSAKCEIPDDREIVPLHDLLTGFLYVKLITTTRARSLLLQDDPWLPTLLRVDSCTMH